MHKTSADVQSWQPVGKTIVRRDETRTVLLDATARLLARYGYGKITVDDIAREAGISRRTFYLYFRSKEEAALASVDRTIDQLVERLREAAESSEPALPRLRRMLLLRVLFLVDKVQSGYHDYDEAFAALRPVYMPRREHYLRAEAEVFARVLEEGRRQGQLELDDPSAMAHTLLLATNSLMPFSLSARQRAERAEIERQLTRIVDVLLRGLQRRRLP